LPVIKKQIPLKVHAHRADDIFTAIRIAKEFDIDITLEHCTDGHLIKEYLKQEKYPVFVGPTLAERSKIELANLSFETPSALANEGVLTSIITDHPVVPCQYITLCAALAVKSGMSENDALAAITINPAKACGIDDRVGSIKEGKDADIVIFDKFPFDIYSNVKYVLINGEMI